ncbi:adenine deaminase C-terminal domain-containing protein [Metabacillus sp. RGM 3146]|uniref:adenine deaminase C-terminal domain-containing protein n=1 Tax=Metabacillus sp. RGM 3146 TaxID=3401092 RepID=UPI003B9964AE
MSEEKFYWKSSKIREQIDIASQKAAPTILLKNGTCLNPYLNQWLTANIWIYEDRIVYVGDELPDHTEGTEIVDCKGQWIVPGYIEPHAHPFQLYNPHSLAKYTGEFGTTTLINDNMNLILNCDKKKALTFMKRFKNLPVHTYWWARLDLQTEIQDEDKLMAPDQMKNWIENDCVVQGGEMTGWPRLLAGDDLMLHYIQEIKRQRKRMEGHFPGASESTLTKMKLFGADADHEAMTGEEVLNRLKLGYHVALRHSSIRPDLPVLLEDMKKLNITHFDHLFFTTDGSPPAYYEEGMTNVLIKIALEHGISPMDAYKMASFNIANYYSIDHLLGSLTPGRFATLNILSNPEEPLPVSVLSKGEWLKKGGGAVNAMPKVKWEELGFSPLQLDWELTADDLQFSMPMGLKMKNAVIMEPYTVTIDSSFDELPMESDESFLALIDKKGKWRINTVLRGFAKNIHGFASSYSTSGDIILIGKNKKAMLAAFKRMNEIGGGIVLTAGKEVLHEIPLHLNGGASALDMPILIEQVRKLDYLLRERGYRFDDPIYSLFFLSSTHLPYIRITPRGIYDVKKKTILFPSIMR